MKMIFFLFVFSWAHSPLTSPKVPEKVSNIWSSDPHTRSPTLLYCDLHKDKKTSIHHLHYSTRPSRGSSQPISSLAAQPWLKRSRSWTHVRWWSLSRSIRANTWLCHRPSIPTRRPPSSWPSSPRQRRISSKCQQASTSGTSSSNENRTITQTTNETTIRTNWMCLLSLLSVSIVATTIWNVWNTRCARLQNISLFWWLFIWIVCLWCSSIVDVNH